MGKVSLGPLSGYLWLLGRRLHLKLGWRSRETYFLGNLGDPLSIAVRLRRLMPRPIERRAAAMLARALAASLYVAVQGLAQVEDTRLGGGVAFA